MSGWFACGGSGWRVVAAVWMLAAGAGVGWGQEGSTVDVAAGAAGVPTLHAYANLVQIPVLILSGNRQRLGGGVPKGFAVSLDAGKPFAPNFVRMEGEDPIALTILVDVSGDQKDLLPKMVEAIASVAPGGLTERDRVSVAALDCSLVHSKEVAGSREELRAIARAAIEGKGAHGEQSCGATIRLVDSMMFLASKMAEKPGRRVLLAITDGHDGGSTRTWNQLRGYLNNTGVAMFGMDARMRQLRRWDRTSTGFEDMFDAVSQLTGGMVTLVDAGSLRAAMERFVAELRERYIVEFPRPKTLTPGPHSVLVTVTQMGAFVRPAGISMPIVSAEEVAHRKEVPGGAADGPEVGTRKILVPER